MKKIRIIAAEDDPDYRFIIERYLAMNQELELLAIFDNAEDTLQAAVTQHPDIVLMDLNLGSGIMEGAELARTIRRKTDSRIIILTGFDAPEIVINACRRAFASAYVLKQQADILIPTILSTAMGITPQSSLILASLLEPLTAAERTVFGRLMGNPVKLHSADKTIANQQSSIIRKMELASKEELYHIFSAYYPSEG